MEQYEAVIIGGGPAGSSTAIGLAREGMKVAVVEKRPFPREVICGEFLSHEVLSALRDFGVFEEFLSLRPQTISTFAFVSERGVPVLRSLGFPAAAMKRSLLDNLLLKKARSSGATVVQPADAASVNRRRDGFEILLKTPSGSQTLSANYVVAAYGRSGALDRALHRGFASIRSGMTGMKYHVPRTMINEFPEDQIRIYCSRDIYCGVNSVGEHEVTLCYLARADGRTPRESLSLLLERNRGFRALFRGDPVAGMEHLPRYGTGNVFFGPRNLVENGVFMAGDAAGVIGPLAGDGIGMAMASGRLLADVLLRCTKTGANRLQMERFYTTEWRRKFARRLRTAALLQRLAMNPLSANTGALLMTLFPVLLDAMIRGTREPTSADSPVPAFR
ncbi:MAG: FAD-dependent oxidoreductase [Bacteroidia bacterium]|nr:MAG: FAD-dependent oxidoreductase [Bacteroidia bacterium]